MKTVTADVWVRPDVAEYAEWIRECPYDRDVFALGVIRGIHRHGICTASETVAALAALAAVEAEKREARP